MAEWLAAISLLLGVLGSFRWLYRKVSDERIGWWDAGGCAFIGPLAARGTRWLAAKVDIIPNWAGTTIGAVMSAAALYVFLRLLHDRTPREAALISIAWTPIVLATVVVFMLLNPELFG